MMEWQISDQDIQIVEELLLPHSAHFPEDARNVIVLLCSSQLYREERRILPCRLCRIQ